MLNKNALAITEVTIYKIFSIFLISYILIAYLIAHKNTVPDNQGIYKCYNWGEETVEICKYSQALSTNFKHTLILLPFLPIDIIKNSTIKNIYLITLLTIPVLALIIPVLIYKKNSKKILPNKYE